MSLWFRALSGSCMCMDRVSFASATQGLETLLYSTGTGGTHAFYISPKTLSLLTGNFLILAFKDS